MNNVANIWLVLCYILSESIVQKVEVLILLTQQHNRKLYYEFQKFKTYKQQQVDRFEMPNRRKSNKVFKLVKLERINLRV